MSSNVETKKKNGGGRGILSVISGDKLVLMAAIVAVFILFTCINSNFFTWTNIVNILVAASMTGTIAVGHTYLIIAAQNDLSPGSLLATCGVTMATLLSFNVPLILAVLITLGVGVLAGVFNAWMVNSIKLEAFIATLVSQMVFRGIAYIICNGRPVAISNPEMIAFGKMRFLTIPMAVWIMVIAMIVFGFILAKTRFGRSVYAIGGSMEAARLAGLNPRRIITICFILIGVLSAVAGIAYAARMNAGQPTAGINLEFDAITAVILGGVSFTGGVGSMGGTALGVFLIQAFNSGLSMIGMSTFWQYIARGALLLFALTTDYIRKERKNKALLEASMKAAMNS